MKKIILPLIAVALSVTAIYLLYSNNALPATEKTADDEILTFSLSMGNSLFGNTYIIEMKEDGTISYAEYRDFRPEPASALHKSLSPSEITKIKKILTDKNFINQKSDDANQIPDAATYRLTAAHGNRTYHLECLMPLPDRKNSKCTASFDALITLLNEILGTQIK